jgi:hypothetical protein
LLGLIAQYGVTKVQELIDEIELNGGQLPDKIKELITCPPPEVISKIIERKNKLVKQLTNVLNSINKATEVLTISQKYISIADISLKILENIPTPTAIGGVGIPISVINGIQKTINFLSQLIGKLNIANGFILSILLLLRATLTQVLNILKLLDLITQYCSGATPTPISAELTALTIQQSNQLSPVVTNVNGFEMGVETEPTTKTLKRRRAIARNKQGVVMLQGEWSYSSIDQILIDELVFYIQQNNLKAD